MHWWAEVLRLIQLEFVKGELPEELTWAAMVFFLKGEGGVLGYRYGGSGVEGMHDDSELKYEEGGRDT